MRDIFVAALCIMGAAIIIDTPNFHRGKHLNTIAGILIFLVVFLPTAPPHVISITLVVILHTLSAVLFFVFLAIISLKSLNSESTQTNNSIIYRACGYCMLFMVVCFIALRFLPQNIQFTLHNIQIVFWLETIATTDFGVA